MVKILNVNPTMDTASITVSAIGISDVKNAGKLRALADVEVVFDGIEMIIQGVKVRADGKSTRFPCQHTGHQMAHGGPQSFCLVRSRMPFRTR